MPISEDYLQSYVPERFLHDERYRRGHINVIAAAEGTRILGMHTPQMKYVAKELVKGGQWREQLGIWTSHRPLTRSGGLSNEERIIWGLVLDYIKVPLGQRLGLIDDFIPAIDNWAICDTFCCNSKWVGKEDKERIWEYAGGLIDSDEEFRARVGLILALSHFLNDHCLERTLRKVADRGYGDDDPYYIRMAVAWLFAEAMGRDYSSALPFIGGRRLSRWIHNKAIQKARESWRVSPEHKEELKALKY